MAAITVTTDPPIDPQTFTPTYYQQLVAELLVAVDQMTAVIPKMEASESVTAKDARRNLNVSAEFCDAAISAVERLPELDGTGKLDVQNARNLLQFIEAFTPLYHQMNGASVRLRHALRAAKSEVGTSALDVYRVARSLASGRRSPSVDVQVEAMKQALGRKTTTKIAREERKAKALQDAVDKELRSLGIDRAQLAKKEVQALIA